MSAAERSFVATQAVSREPLPAAGRFSVRGAIIDLDGTLLDTIADLAAAANAMLAELGRAALPVEQIATYVGKGAEVLVHRVLTRSPDGRAESALAARALAAFYRHYERENGVHAVLFPGVVEGLEAMRARGLKLACVTNKPQAFAEKLLADKALAGYFDLIVGGDALPRRKPDPLPMLHVCERFGIAPLQMLAIGDSVNDAAAAHAAGMPVLVVPYGYNEARAVATIDADGIVATLAEVPELLAD